MLSDALGSAGEDRDVSILLCLRGGVIRPKATVNCGPQEAHRAIKSRASCAAGSESRCRPASVGLFFANVANR
jgi:hypothetical protein